MPPAPGQAPQVPLPARKIGIIVLKNMHDFGVCHARV
jgi:hypothetical protein